MAAAAAAATSTSTRDGQTDLALRLAKPFAPPPSAHGGDNVAFSPVSIHAALALAAAGARGDTLAQLLAFLGAPSARDLADFGRRLADGVLADRPDSGGPRVLFGGSVWVDASRGGLTDAFRNVATKSYKCEARIVSFTKEPTKVVDMINQWVEKGTNNLTDTVICLGHSDTTTDLVLANTVYFKGAWLHPFHASSSKRGNFQLLNGRHAEAIFMAMMYTKLHVACMNGFKVLRLPYKPGRVQNKASPDASNNTMQYSMFVFLPDAHDGIAGMVDILATSPEFLYGVLAATKETNVNLHLPRFEISFSWTDLKEDFQRLGLSLPFSPTEAELQGMCSWGARSSRPTFLNMVAHKAVVKVNEAGTNTAVVTMATSSDDGPLPDLVEFIANHPFTFFIMEERSGVIVFAGHVLDPTNTKQQ